MAVVNRDGANVTSPDWSLQAVKTITFAGGTTNAIGDHDGTNDPFTIFEVEGACLVRVLARCTTNLEGASATLRVGTALSDAGLIASTTATDIDANEIWHDATPDASVELSSVLTQKIVSQDIIGTVGAANITAGVIEFVCYWFPLTPDSSVRPA